MVAMKGSAAVVTDSGSRRGPLFKNVSEIRFQSYYFPGALIIRLDDDAGGSVLTWTDLRTNVTRCWTRGEVARYDTYYDEGIGPTTAILSPFWYLIRLARQLDCHSDGSNVITSDSGTTGALTILVEEPATVDLSSKFTYRESFEYTIRGASIVEGKVIGEAHAIDETGNQLPDTQEYGGRLVQTSFVCSGFDLHSSWPNLPRSITVSRNQSRPSKSTWQQIDIRITSLAPIEQSTRPAQIAKSLSDGLREKFFSSSASAEVASARRPARFWLRISVIAGGALILIAGFMYFALRTGNAGNR